MKQQFFHIFNFWLQNKWSNVSNKYCDIFRTFLWKGCDNFIVKSVSNRFESFSKRFRQFSNKSEKYQKLS